MPNTGFSLLQGGLVTNADALRNKGFFYSKSSHFDNQTVGRVAAGNGRLVNRLQGELPGNSILSSERLLLELEAYSGLILGQKYAGHDVRVICYVRDLVPLCISGWQREVTRGGYTQDLEYYADNDFDPGLMQVLDWIRFCETHQIDIRISNYSRHKHDLWKHFLTEGAGINEISDLPLFDEKKVNRSLSSSELYLQKEFNRFYGKRSSTFISDVLMNQLPDERGHQITLAASSVDRLWNKFSDVIQRLNPYLDPDEMIELDNELHGASGESEVISGELRFTVEQVRALVQAIAKQLSDVTKIDHQSKWVGGASGLGQAGRRKPRRYPSVKEKIKRTDIINFVLEQQKRIKKSECAYLEIGVRFPEDNFNKVIAKHKFSVDPGVENLTNPVDFPMTSDEFFTRLRLREIQVDQYPFDCIFIDGLHLAEQVDRDVESALRNLAPGGVILLHDSDPPTYGHARECYDDHTTEAGDAWNGTVWKVITKLRKNALVSCVTLPVDWGVSAIFPAPGLVQPLPENHNTYYEYEVFKASRAESLGLVSGEQFKALLRHYLRQARS